MMMKKIQELITKDLGWKVLSVVIATALWFMVININQPVDIRNYSRNITLENLEELESYGLTLTDIEQVENTKITVRVKAQRTYLDRLSQNPSAIKASVDLSRLVNCSDGETVTLAVNVSMQNYASSYEILSRSPATIEVKVESLTTKEVPIQVTMDGELEEGVLVSEPTLSAERVYVTGARSAVERVESVSALVSAQTVMSGGSATVPLTACDASGAPVSEVSLSAGSVTVSYSLLETKTIPVRVEITGTPAQGYTVGDISCSPASVQITADADTLNRVHMLQLDVIDVSGMNQSETFRYFLSEYLPEGVLLAEGQEEQIEVSVEILEAEDAELTLQASQVQLINEQDGFSYELQNNPVLHLRGTQEDLEALEQSHLHVTADVSQLSEGEHTVAVSVTLPDGIYLTEESTVSVRVTALLTQETQTE